MPGWFWIVLSSVLLGGGLLAGGVMLFVSWNHPSLKVDAGYYRQAVSYDDIKAQEARNRALGWETTLAVERKVSAGVPGTEVLLVLQDADGAPVTGAEVVVEAFHLARAGERFSELLPELAPGEYGAGMPLRRQGIWEFRIAVRRGEDLYTAVLEREF